LSIKKLWYLYPETWIFIFLFKVLINVIFKSHKKKKTREGVYFKIRKWMKLVWHNFMKDKSNLSLKKSVHPFCFPLKPNSWTFLKHNTFLVVIRVNDVLFDEFNVNYKLVIAKWGHEFVCSDFLSVVGEILELPSLWDWWAWKGP